MVEFAEPSLWAPAGAFEVWYWVSGSDRPGTLVLRGAGGYLVLARRPGEVRRRLVAVLPETVDELERRGWRRYRTHMLPPGGGGEGQDHG